MRFIVIISLVLIPFFGFSQQSDSAYQEKPSMSIKDRLFWGGSFWMQFGNNTFVNISPRVGYRINDKLSAGIGIKYQYLSRFYPTYNYTEKASLYGGSVFSRYKLTEQLFLLGEYEHLNIKNFWISNYGGWTDFLFVGAGYHHNFGGVSAVSAQLLYDVLENPLLPYFYYTPTRYPIVFRIGVTFGI